MAYLKSGTCVSQLKVVADEKREKVAHTSSWLCYCSFHVSHCPETTNNTMLGDWTTILWKKTSRKFLSSFVKRALDSQAVFLKITWVRDRSCLGVPNSLPCLVSLNVAYFLFGRREVPLCVQEEWLCSVPNAKEDGAQTRLIAFPLPYIPSVSFQLTPFATKVCIVWTQRFNGYKLEGPLHTIRSLAYARR